MTISNLKRTLSLIAYLLLATAIFQACKKDKRQENSAINAKEFAAIFGPQAQRIQIDPNIPNSFILKGGTKITIPAGAFKMNGVAVTGSVTITAAEFLKRSHIVFSGTSTNHISGAPLESDGFIFLNASVGSTPADKALNHNILMAIPTKNTRSTEIWEGVEQVGNNNQFAWQAPLPNPNGQFGIPLKSSPVAGFYNFEMGNLGWINCDVFYAYSNPKTTVSVTVTNNPGNFATFMGFTGETFVFFCAKGSNVVAQLYNENGPNSVKSYTDMMPIGIEGKYISFAIKDGKYYYAAQESTITANQSINLTLAETTETAIQNAINSLNTY